MRQDSIPDPHPFRSEKARRRYLDHYDLRAKKWPVPSESWMVETSFGETFIRMSGPPDAPPLVLLPGINSTSLMWIPNIEGLSKKFRVYAIDNIYDFGRSIWLKPFKSGEDFVGWLEELFTVLGLERVHLMGISYGGWLASQYALQNPNRVAKIVLLAPVFTIVPLRLEFALKALLCLIPIRAFTRKFMHWLAQDSIRKNDVCRSWVEDMVKDGFLGIRSFKPKRLIPPTLLTDEELRSIQVPTLYLVGENEKINSPQAALERLNRVAPQIQAEMISDAGHDLTIAQAEKVNQKVLEFLESAEVPVKAKALA